MLQGKDVIEMAAPLVIKENSRGRLCNYLIQRKDQDKFLVHRELEEGEHIYYRSEDLFLYKKSLYLYGIASFSTKEESIKNIVGYWKVQV